MSSEKPNFLAQPVVKSIFVFRNGDPYYEARRIVINQKRVSNFETLLREVTGGVQAPFGAVRNIYTPRGGHKVDSLESLQSGEQYVAAGRERFKKLDYHQITSRKKKMLLPMQAKPLMQNRIIVSARFLKPIKEPCTIFVVANGDVLNPAMRILIHQRMLGQFERILEMITEKMGLRVLGGVRSLYTYEGHQVTDRNQLENGQLYVAVGRERFKKLPYSDLLFTRPRGRRRVNGMKAYSLPPLYKFSKQNGNTSPSKSKSTTQCSDSGDGDSKASPPGHDDDNNREQLSSIVRQISQARLISLRKRRSGQSEILGSSDNGDAGSVVASSQVQRKICYHSHPADDLETKTDDTNTENKTLNNYTDDEHPADANNDAKATQEPQEESVEATAENTTEEDTMIDKEETQDMNGEKEEGGEKEKSYDQNDEREGRATVESEEKEVKEELKEEVTDAGEGAVKSEEQGISHSNVDEIQDSEAKEEGSNSSSEGEKDEPDTSMGKEKPDEDAGSEENGSNDQNNDVDTGEEQKDTETSNDPENTETDN